jgi:transposase
MKKSKKKQLSEEEIKIALTPLTDEQLETLSAKDLRALVKGERKILEYYKDIAERAVALNQELEDKILCIEGVLVKIKTRFFGHKSERSPKKEPPAEPLKKEKIRPVKKTRDLEERYPKAEVLDKEVRLEILPNCSCCNNAMAETGIFEKSQSITYIPGKYLITNILRMKYGCEKCHGDIKTTPQLPRIIPRSSYGDSFIMDLVLSKFCDLIPTERYCEMASRGGFAGLPANSLHEVIWRAGQFFQKVYELIRIETLDARILLGDETPHKMLEGTDKQWYLWGFFSSTSCFFEYHDSRSGDVAGDILSESSCEYFMSDAYSGYSKAIRETNELRTIAELAHIVVALCNAHARRYFVECKEENEDKDFFVKEYEAIYKVEKEIKELLPVNKTLAAEKRGGLKSSFEAMKEKALNDLLRYPSKHAYYGACQYFLNNYEGLTTCLLDPEIPMDNNQSERGLRSHVVGRKTWYGTHSKDGAEAAAIHFSLVESCKLNKVNPREYYATTIEAIHYKKPLLTPSQYKKKLLEKVQEVPASKDG